MEKEELTTLEITTQKGSIQLKKGENVSAVLAPFSNYNYPIKFIGDIETISIGSYVGEDLNHPKFQITDIFWTHNSSTQIIVLDLMALADVYLDKKNRYLVWKNTYTLARITLSDKGFIGEREDLSGPIIEEIIKNQLPISLCLETTIPDNYYLLLNVLTEMAFLKKVDLIITTGGTGVTERDITPDATEKIIERRLWGFEHAIFSEGLKKTKHAIISRAICGIAKQSLIINLPGSKKAVLENLSTILPALRHTLDKIKNDPTECGK
ncbi:MogA/MoaB family molybdenum cofactor biosynthesis protein [Desulfothermus sp.]